MPSGKRCKCRPKRTYERVTVRKGNFSVFEKPAGQFHKSKWSLIVCSKCGHRWRSMAGWVDNAPDEFTATKEAKA